MNELHDKTTQQLNVMVDDGELVCSIGLLYQKTTSTGYENKIRVCFIDYDPDEYICKGRGESYFANHPDFNDELKGFNVVAWQVSAMNQNKEA